MKTFYSLFLATATVLLVGCGPELEKTEGLVEITLQTDWFAQPEHGGFYQALAKGFYEEEGLKVTILQGGPNAMTTQKVIKGSAQFAMHRADAVYKMVERGVEVEFLFPTLQHDPQALMLHADNPVNSFEELNGESVIAIPGLSWIQWVENRYNISFEVIPHDFGMERFLNDPQAIQQCLVTNEPYYARRAGIPVKTIAMSKSGFDPYHGIYALKEFVQRHPEVVASFARASLRGWQDFIENDPSPALELIHELNPKMTKEFMQFTYSELKSEKLVTGKLNTFGQLSKIRLDLLETQMKAVGMADESSKLDWYELGFDISLLKN